jgi:signal transduction histidine kinase/ligand-binding sensor domain-containing protein
MTLRWYIMRFMPGSILRFRRLVLLAGSVGFALLPGPFAVLAGPAGDGPPAESVFSSAYQPTIGKLTVNDGLPENSVRAIAQDRSGFLWFGTQNGLVRYDGYEMRVFLPSPDDSAAIGDRTIEAILEDSDGYIWVGTFLNGLWRFDPERETFRGYSFHHGTGGRHVHSVIEDADRRLWVGLDNGLVVLSPEAREASWIWPASDSEEVEPVAFSALGVDQRGNVWAGTESRGIAVIERGTTQVHFFDTGRAGAHLLSDTVIRAIFLAPDGALWVGSDKGLSLWSPGTDTFVPFVPPPDANGTSEPRMLSIAAARDGVLWIGSVGRVYAFDPVARRFRAFVHDPERLSSLVNAPVLSIYCDRSGLIWAGSWLGGINRIDPAGAGFRVRRHDPADSGSLPHSLVEAVYCEPDGVVWVATGKFGRDSDVGALSRAETIDAPFRTVSPPADDGFGVGRSFHRDENGVLWIGTSNGVWRLIDGRPAAVRLEPGPAADRLRKANVRSMASQGDYLWLATTNEGLFRLDKRGGQLAHFVHDAEDTTSISQQAVVVVHVDARGQVWAGTDARGLNLFEADTRTFRRFFDPRLGLDSVVDIHDGPDGDLWLGTFAGLLRFNPGRGVVESVGITDGLPNDLVVSILEDDAGRLWLATGRGLACYKPGVGVVKTYEERDGLPGNDAQFASYRGSDGTLFFGGAGGLVSFRPSDIHDSSFMPPVVLTGMTVSDQPLRIGKGSPLPIALNLAETISLDHDENDLSFSFASLDYGRPERNHYRFRLEDYDNVWRESGSRRTATYTNLAPGNYVFRVQGTNRDGVWNESGASLRIHISPPWWRTTWAQTLYFLFIAGILVLGYRQIMQRARMRMALAVERAEAAHFHELDRVKSRFLANISHEFRTPLTLIETPLQRLSKQPDSGDSRLFETMARNARRLGQLIDQLLDLSRLEAGRLPVKWHRGDSLAFLRALVSSFDSFAGARGVHVDVRIPDGSADAWFDSDIVEKIVTNLMSNAFKFTPEGGTVLVEVSAPEVVVLARVPRMGRSGVEGNRHGYARRIQISVSNTGSYIPPAERKRIFDRFHEASPSGGTGIGLSLVKELVEWMNGEVTVESDPQTGTRFQVILPFFTETPVAEPAGTPDVTGESLTPEPSDADEEGAESEGAEDAPIILVVEDHQDLRSYLRHELPPDFRVMEAENGRIGFERAVAEIPDLVLSDVMMPEMDGFELCEKLKEDERTSHIPGEPQERPSHGRRRLHRQALQCRGTQVAGQQPDRSAAQTRRALRPDRGCSGPGRHAGDVRGRAVSGTRARGDRGPPGRPRFQGGTPL